MIFDRLEHSAVYDALGTRFAAGLAYLRDRNLAVIEDGRYGIVGDDDVFAIVQSYTTKRDGQGRWEAHRTYADIQCVIRGSEMMGCAPINMMRVETPYDAEKDLEFFTGDGQFIGVDAGEFTIFFPHDVHMPSMSFPRGQGPFTTDEDGDRPVKKVVIKVRLR